MKKLKTDSTDWTTKKNHRRVLYWIVAWSVTMVLADKAELYEWHSSALISILAIIINAGIGIGMIVTYMRFLTELDELQRKIQLDSLALSLGVALVGSYSYILLVTAQFISDAEISHIVLLMAFTYVVGLIVGQVRYR